MNKTIIINGRIVLPEGVLADGCVEFADGKITPGFIDIHTHVAGGHDFMDGTVEAYLGAAQMHARHGTTALLPTTLTSTNEEL